MNQQTLCIYTDARSDKVGELTKSPRACLPFGALGSSRWTGWNWTIVDIDEPVSPAVSCMLEAKRSWSHVQAGIDSSNSSRA